MKYFSGDRGSDAQLVTEAQVPKSQDISRRERRYLITMGVRIVCFIVAVVLFANGFGWLALFPAVGAIVLPYFAVVFANGGREPGKSRGLRDLRPGLTERSTPALDRPRHIAGFATLVETDPGPRENHGSAGPPGSGHRPDAAPTRGAGAVPETPSHR